MLVDLFVGTVTLFCVLLVGLTISVRLQRNLRSRPSVAFFHPYCNRGGGGERVLWSAIRVVQEKCPNHSIVIYSGETTGVTKRHMINKAKNTFGIEIKCENLTIVHLCSRFFVEGSTYPVFTLIGQSIGSVLLGIEAVVKYTPCTYLDTQGYAFTLPLFKLIAGSKTGSYVHFPAIHDDMLEKVTSQGEAVNNRSFIAQSRLLTYAKLAYYRMFQGVYGVMGSCSDVVMCNSSWTRGHIARAWKYSKPLVVFPPCNVVTFQGLPLDEDRVKDKIVSVAQFRPEKNHALQLHALSVLIEKYKRIDARLVLVGGVRDCHDQARVDALNLLANKLNLAENVEFQINASFDTLLHELKTSRIGIHTMENEHFGIGIVEFMAAGCIPVAHNSGGPRSDIIPEKNKTTIGFRATTANEYAEKMDLILGMNTTQAREIQTNGRLYVENIFSDEAFDTSFYNAIEPLMK